jgi:hypothetical protein
MEGTTVWNRILVFAAAIVLAHGAVIGCGGSTPTSPSDITTSKLLSAPTHVVADGKGLTLAAFLWRDFMPISPPDGKALVAVLSIRTDDGSPVPAAITVDTSWTILNMEVWSAAVEQRPRAETAPIYQVIARNGPKWGPNVAVDVVVRLADSRGRAFLLRAPGQTIAGSY